MEKLDTLAQSCGIVLSDTQLSQFDVYQAELKRWNAKTNLIASSTESDIVTRHFLDSLTALPYILKPDARIIDIGCGAGFPGIPIKIARPGLRVWLLEASRKKASFLKHMIQILNLADSAVLNQRVEELLTDDDWRGKFDIVISRAAFKLPDMLPVAAYLLSPKGLLIALKSNRLGEEWTDAQIATEQFGLYELLQHDISTPGADLPRKIIIAQKP